MNATAGKSQKKQGWMDSPLGSLEGKEPWNTLILDF
jgi:hypothetical protein